MACLINSGKNANQQTRPKQDNLKEWSLCNEYSPTLTLSNNYFITFAGRWAGVTATTFSTRLYLPWHSTHPAAIEVGVEAAVSIFQYFDNHFRTELASATVEEARTRVGEAQATQIGQILRRADYLNKTSDTSIDMGGQTSSRGLCNFKGLVLFLIFMVSFAVVLIFTIMILFARPNVITLWSILNVINLNSFCWIFHQRHLWMLSYL